MASKIPGVAQYLTCYRFLAAAAMEILMLAYQATVSSAHVAFTDAKVAMRRICCPMHVTVAMSDPDCPS